MIVGLLANEYADSVNKWIIACEKKKIEYKVINLLDNNWLELVNSRRFDFFLARPSGELEYYKTAYDERLYIINVVLRKNVYPSYNETFYYENKRFLSYYLQAKNILHPTTSVFYNKKESLDFINNVSFPIVAKTNIGASGTGVLIIRDLNQIKRYINRAFSKKGIKRRFGPNRVTGTPTKWLKKALLSPSFFMNKMRQYIKIANNNQKNYVIFQEYIQHDFEWRIVKIGESYFGHKKIKNGDMASGSKGIEYINPPIKLLDYVRDICINNGINMMAIDLFEGPNNNYYVNEMQTIFGHVQSYICKVDGKIGRYIYNNKWIFEEGEYNSNESYDLRLEMALNLNRK